MNDLADGCLKTNIVGIKVCVMGFFRYYLTGLKTNIVGIKDLIYNFYKIHLLCLKTNIVGIKA